MGELAERAKERIFGMSATSILLLVIAVFFALAATLVAIVATIPPESTLVRYPAFVILLLALFISRTIEPWQWGLEVYQITIFTMALTFGMTAALLATLVTFLMFPISWSIETPYDFYLTKNYIGPIVQTAVLFFISVIGGLLGTFAYESTVANFTYYYLGTLVFSDMLIGNYLRFKITPLPIYRIAVYSLIVLVVNYQLALNGSGYLLKLMIYLKG